MGWVVIARKAGTTAASTATVPIDAAAIESATGSWDDTPYSMLPIDRSSQRLTTTPANDPIAASRAAPTST